MLQSFYIDGFKSLEKCRFTINPGLNAIVGLNGSGKSNVLGAMEFSSYVLSNKLTEVPTKLGIEDIDEIFCLSREKKEIELELIGENRTEYRNLQTPKLVSNENSDELLSLFTKYKYHCRVQYNPSMRKPFLFNYQKVELDFLIRVNDATQRNRLVIEYDNSITEILENNMKTVKTHITNELDFELLESKKTFVDLDQVCLLNEIGQLFFPMKNVVDELIFGKVYDFQPNVIRGDLQKGLYPEIQPDGGGLANVLLYLKEHDPDKLRFIIDEVKLLSKHIYDIEVSYNELDKKIQIDTMIRKNYIDESCDTVSFKRLPDGALKWIALVTISTLSDKPLLIDEPENNLFPDMHREYVSFLRKILHRSDRFGIISSHSNVFVDSLEPEELIVVHFEDGCSHANRVKDLEKFKKDMEKTGHGLGWYYESGSLDFYCY